MGQRMSLGETPESLTAVVTGAGKGIGLELVRPLADEGFDIVLTARTQQAVDKGLGELTERGRVEARILEIADAHSI